ncbi:hypothetical protein HK405_003325 [Cladochytrium tenue]|nr:hypothetical protein HK405_003325 [Cladochytrium tenue]
MGDFLPSEVLEAILLWLHPHEVIRLRRLSRANAGAVEALHVDVLFRSQESGNQLGCPRSATCGEQAVIDCVLDQCEMELTAYAMTWVALQPNMNLVRSFFSWYSQKFYFTPSWTLNGAVICAASFGHLDVMNYLLTLHSEQETVDRALAFAEEEGWATVCKRLMTARADPRFERMRTLRNSIKNEHVQVIELFVRDPRVKIALDEEASTARRLLAYAANRAVWMPRYLDPKELLPLGPDLRQAVADGMRGPADVLVIHGVGARNFRTVSEYGDAY